MFRPNPHLAEQLRVQPQFQVAMRVIAEPVRATAEAFSRAAGGPWMPRKGAKGPAVLDLTEDGARITLTGHGDHLMEYGSRNNPPHAPLRRSVRTVGLKLTE